MKNFTNALTLLLVLFTTIVGFAQSGQYDVRFNMNNVDCEGSEIFVDIEVRANSAATTFNLSDQNYRFSYNRAAVHVGSVAIETMHLTGFVPPASFYDPHTLTGSLDTVVSYNVVLAGGDGVPVTTDWLTVGTISFTILDASQCLDLIWHDHAPENFPPTFIGEKYLGDLYAAEEALYLNTSVCPEPICVPVLPVELTKFDGKENNCQIELNWETLSETNNEYFNIEKSTNGFDFKVIGTVNGQGTTSSRSTYNFTDEQVSTKNYYRLVQVDFDGTTTISEAITIASTCYDASIGTAITDIYPNPVSQGPVNIKFYTLRQIENAEVIIIDALGRTVQVSEVSIAEGPNTLRFETDNLANGTYFVRVASDDWFTAPQKFMKVSH